MNKIETDENFTREESLSCIVSGLVGAGETYLSLCIKSIMVAMGNPDATVGDVIDAIRLGSRVSTGMTDAESQEFNCPEHEDVSVKICLKDDVEIMVRLIQQ